jgi:hypothetical protein
MNKNGKFLGVSHLELFRAAWIDTNRNVIHRDFIQFGGRKTTINWKREKVRRQKVKNAFLIVRFSNKDGEFEAVKLGHLMWKNCVCPEIRLTTACLGEIRSKHFDKFSPALNVCAFQERSQLVNWCFLSHIPSVFRKRNPSSVLQNYLFLVINTKNLQLQICSSFSPSVFTVHRRKYLI